MFTELQDSPNIDTLIRPTKGQEKGSILIDISALLVQKPLIHIVGELSPAYKRTRFYGVERSQSIYRAVAR